MEVALVRSIMFAKDMVAMARFYQDVLGLEEVVTPDTSDDWRVFQSGAMELALHGIPAQYAAGIVISDPPEARESAVTKLVFKVGDAAAVRSALKAQGVIEVNEAFHRSGEPLVRCDFLDPEGNVFQISSE